MSGIPREHLEKLCLNKVQYTKKQGESLIRIARKRGRIITPTLKVYKCRFCWAYHIGHERLAR